MNGPILYKEGPTVQGVRLSSDNGATASTQATEACHAVKTFSFSGALLHGDDGGNVSSLSMLYDLNRSLFGAIARQWCLVHMQRHICESRAFFGMYRVYLRVILLNYA